MVERLRVLADDENLLPVRNLRSLYSRRGGHGRDRESRLLLDGCDRRSPLYRRTNTS